MADEAVDHGGDPVRFLVTKLFGPGDDRFALGEAAKQRDQRSSSIASGTSPPPTRVASRGPWRAVIAPHGSPPGALPLLDLERRPHPVQVTEQPDPGRVEADALDPDLAAGHEQGGGQHERGRGDVAGHVDALQLELPAWAYRDPLRGQ